MLIDSMPFEYYTFLHHSQTKTVKQTPSKRLNTIRFYIILKPSCSVRSAVPV